MMNVEKFFGEFVEEDLKICLFSFNVNECGCSGSNGPNDLILYRLVRLIGALYDQ